MSSTLPATTSSNRRFEFVRGNSSKFWQITVHGTEVPVVYGRIGTTGQTNNKQFANTADAVKHAEKLIREDIEGLLGSCMTHTPSEDRCL